MTARKDPIEIDPMEQGVSTLHELQGFLTTLHDRLEESSLKPGDDLRRRAEELQVPIPAALRDVPITFEDYHEGGSHARHSEAAGREALVLMVPHHENGDGPMPPLERKIFCVRVRQWRVCLDCGWLWCQIVVERRF